MIRPALMCTNSKTVCILKGGAQYCVPLYTCMFIHVCLLFLFTFTSISKVGAVVIIIRNNSSWGGESSTWLIKNPCIMYVFCIDDESDLRRGKVTSLLLPQEDMLERFISNLTKTHKSWRTTTKQMFGRVKRVSVCQWRGVACHKDQTVSQIEWFSMKLSGTLQWEFLPYTLQCCNLVNNRLGGSLQLDILPAQLTYLTLSVNTFIGELNLTQLPNTLHTLELRDNQFEGSVNLTNLCSALKFLYLHENKLSGAVDLSHLPKNLQYLQLSRNRLTGSLSLQHLPSSLTYFLSDHNCFSGLVVFGCLPENLQFLSMSNNVGLYGEIDSSVLPKTLQLDFCNTNIRYK